ncbi:MAG: cytochrome c biogenesis protein CcdA [Thermoguttaceae bacterium]
MLVSPALAQMGRGFGGPGSGFMQGASEPVVTVTGQFTPPDRDKPGYLFLTAKIKPDWHIYSITQGEGGPVPTKINLNSSDQYRVVGSFQATSEPEKKKEAAFGGITVESHSGTVTWFAPVEFARGVDPASVKAEGSLVAQPCDAGSCLPPQRFPFTATLGAVANLPVRPEQSAVPPQAAVPATSPGTTTPARESAEAGRLPWRPFTMATFRQLVGPQFAPEVMRQSLASVRNQSSMVRELLLGFVGGLLLNLMPCVLPVIGLKILSFVEQSGHDRRHALALNVWYAAGLMAVFMLLATLAVSLNMGWGHLFKYAGFNIAMAAVVFAMAISFLGVWEIPIPGFVGRGRSLELAEKEGFAGAFTKGVITTILATPCTGPFMGTALAWAVNQSPLKTYAVFASVGIGMASPYLLIGAFPQLVRFLPKPGAWMDGFKQFLGFVLLGTVVYIFTFLDVTYIVPTIGLLFAIWAACHWIGDQRLIMASPTAKVRAWGQAVLFVAAMWILLFPGLDRLISGQFAVRSLHAVMAERLEKQVDRQLASQLEERGLRLVQGEQPPTAATGPTTILLDFTADWCATCKTLEATVLNTKAVREAVERNGVVPLQADWTHEAPEVTQFLDWLGFRQVPIIAIFPAETPNQPIVFAGWYQQRDILAALEKAGPSKRSPPVTQDEAVPQAAGLLPPGRPGRPW